jgi:hypothetical protein
MGEGEGQGEVTKDHTTITSRILLILRIKSPWIQAPKIDFLITVKR